MVSGLVADPDLAAAWFCGEPGDDGPHGAFPVAFTLEGPVDHYPEDFPLLGGGVDAVQGIADQRVFRVVYGSRMGLRVELCFRDGIQVAAEKIFLVGG